ncbi:undecaprenyl/decaprenyl-phosphate alpha-N-acetylglucosaminyl 1-phosphate transferase [Mariprofundus sp. NF]|uniref:glycosyltransferase family 4 protein n=1 Tax=Mariprofundus sp. NF TaxID=2608716 RepID=UPI0015A0AF94|nr:MraY family glycosyltransferase [Mariprofundus sp. NF]NWF39479.1 undecaprenyl/decaprenyl-phosphate alpha-N-acetylglucosaminyl 1-phosphate transferase [Mariprofundus sp. NF]
MQNNMFITYALPLLSSILLTLLVMPAVVRLAQRLGAVDQPNERKVHAIATPRMGGVAFFISLLLIPFTMLDVTPATQGFLLGLFIVGCTGFADDIFDISPRLKFLGIIAGTSVFIVMSGTAINDLGDLFDMGNIETGWFAIPLTLIGMVGFINALNLSDGLDGLAAGITLIAAYFLGSFALSIGDQASLIIAIVLFGSMIGFLYFNSHPARIFMGDTGSLILGYVLACLCLMLLQSGEGAVISPISMGILLGLPLSDTLYVMTKRVMKGKSPFQPDKTHFHHRLIELGLSHKGVVATFYGLIFFYASVAALFAGSAEWMQSLVLLGLVAGTYLTLALLERGSFSFAMPADDEVSDSPAAHHSSSYYSMTRALGRSIPVVTWVIPLVLLLPVVMIERSTTMALCMAVMMVLVVILYPWREGRDATWSQGLIYLLIFALLFQINMSEQSWVLNYMVVMTGLLALWVVLKLYFKRNMRVFLTTGLESLLLVFSWVTPWLIGRFNLFSADIQASLYVVCVEAVIFLVAAKIVLRRQPKRNTQMLVSLLILAAISLF